jgi:hypothetical protein
MIIQCVYYENVMSLAISLLVALIHFVHYFLQILTPRRIRTLRRRHWEPSIHTKACHTERVEASKYLCF